MSESACQSHLMFLYGGDVLHCLLEGSLSRISINQALKRCLALLKKHPEVSYLVFDVEDAKASGLSVIDIRQLVEDSRSLFRVAPKLVILGVASRDLEFGLMRMWDSMVMAPRIGVHPGQVVLFRDRMDTFKHLSARLSWIMVQRNRGRVVVGEGSVLDEAP